MAAERPPNMPSALNPAEIFERAAEEGKRRLDYSLLALLATGFIAGFTIIFGSAAQALIHSAALPHFDEFASVLGALGFAVGVVFLIVGRAELFSENFFDPIATAFEGKERHVFRRLLRLWVLTFALNIVGGTLLILALSVDGALPAGARESLMSPASEIAERAPWATFARSVVGGALVALLSFLVIAAQSTGARAMMAYAVGVMLALGPFEHVVVSMLHLLFGLFIGADLAVQHIARVGAISLAGNLIGGIGLVTLSHAAQALGEEGG
ncbi:formate/nitrite transporter family protein [Erythrobacter sp. SD-21]|uniref:formate/nitrite transporter family protein n=1 Tax=Erythrobacter sp. SD-21 TaxID=161528 RepID=UPI000153F0D7|nr:formate/nitrite transporter family protein [Erythrobacter sp. SD-21]EDL47797.1 putative transport [Erythrobacter sp. SD-21]